MRRAPSVFFRPACARTQEPLLARCAPHRRTGASAAGSRGASSRLQPSAGRKNFASISVWIRGARADHQNMDHQNMSQDRVSGKRPSIIFPGGGIYFWWQAGALKALQETCDLDEYHFAGASAGSLSAVFAACNVDMDEVYRSAHRLAAENGIWERREGLAGVWGSLIQTWLEEMLPEDAAQRCSGRVSISVTELRPWLMPFRRCQVQLIGWCLRLPCLHADSCCSHYSSNSACRLVILLTEGCAIDIGIQDERGRHPGLLGKHPTMT